MSRKANTSLLPGARQGALEQILPPSGETEQYTTLAERVAQDLESLGSYIGKSPNLSWLLPAVFRLGGKQFSLKNHYQFEPYFDVAMPREVTLKTARQLGKSQQISVRAVLLSWLIPGYRLLFMTPLSEQARRLSNDYVRPLIESSVLAKTWVKSNTDKAVWRRGMANSSLIYFSFAKLDVERARGYSVFEVDIDEYQDFNPEFDPIVRETMSAHPQWGLRRRSGTPKTPENGLEMHWKASSMAEWFIPCEACNFDNIPSMDHHLERMIGPYRDDISEHQPGLICARCRRPVQPADGFWVHRDPSKADDKVGLHISQPIAWTHYSYPSQWSQLLQKMNTYSPQKFANEVLGESFGVGIQLVSSEELQRAANLGWNNTPNDPRAVLPHIRGYRSLCLAVDWGGGGETGLSLTVVTLMGLSSNGQVHVLWGKRMLNPDHIDQAKEIYDLFHLFGCQFIAHDFTGAGHGREILLNQSGIGKSRLVPIALQTLPGLKIIKQKEGSVHRPRTYYIVDKPKSLQTTCTAIRLGLVRFYNYDFKSTEEPGLIHDFLALIENLADSQRGSPIYTIIRNATLTDDFAQAVNIGCCALWQTTGTWPDMDLYENLQKRIGEFRTHEEDFEDDFEISDEEARAL